MSAGPSLKVTVIQSKGGDPIPDATVDIIINDRNVVQEDLHLSEKTDENGKKTFRLT